MNILALHTQHNATAAYMKDGIIQAVVSEEKFSNVKNDDSFPQQAIRYIMATYDVHHFDTVILCSEQSTLKVDAVERVRSQQTKGAWVPKAILALHKFGGGGLYQWLQGRKFKASKQKRQAALEQTIKDLNLFSYDTLTFYNHHDCHAYAAYGSLRPATDNSAPALVFTADGQGDFSCARVYRATPKGLTCIADTYWTHSLGELYGKVTKLLGMKQLEHEYKVMGLAPYAEDKDYYKQTRSALFDGLLSVKEDLTFFSRLPMHLIDRVLKKKIAYHRFDNIAAALQTFTEDLTLSWIEKAIKKTGISTVYTGGGLFMNVKVNKKIQEHPATNACYFMPSSGDESLPIGALYKYHLDQTGSLPPALPHIYLGPQYSNEQIAAFIKDHDLGKDYDIQYYDDIEGHIASQLSQGEIVARFKGRTEWGARSLGNRAILARPDRMESFFKVNDQVKMRDFWMPFAPSMLRETYQTYIHAPEGQIAPYMITSFDSTEKGQNDFCAALHNRDKTLRAQIVDADVNPDYHRLLSLFYQETGIGGLLNTSFNLHGYPLVSTPIQALFTLQGCHLRHLAIENYYLIKK